MKLPPYSASRGQVVAYSLVALVSIAVYSGTLGHGFAFDDVTEVVRNQQIRSLADLPKMFSSGAWAGAGEPAPIYRPLTTLTYALNYASGQLSPVGYHLVNVLLHAASSVLVLALGLRLGLASWPAALAALLFAVHPAHVEVVANVAGRKDALAALFVVLSVLLHPRAVRRGGLAMTAAPLAFAAALLSKESGVAVLGLVAAWDLFLGRGDWLANRRRALALYAAYGAVFCLYLAARYSAVGTLGVPLDLIPCVENPAAHARAWTRVLTAVSVLGRGVLLLVAPVKLSPDYSFNAVPLVTTPLDGGLLLSLAALLCIGAAAVVSWRRSGVVAFLVLWYFLSIFPASNLLLPVGTIFGERLLYLPSVAFCLALATVPSPAWRPGTRRALAFASLAVLVAFAARTVAGASVWSDEVSLFRAATRAQPHSGKSHELYGAALMEEGRVAEGLPELETAVRILGAAPEPPIGPLVKLGVAYEGLRRWDDAARVYADVLRRSPDYPDALWRLGVVRWAVGRRAEAEQLWLRTVAVAPGHARALSDLGLAAQGRGDLPAAEGLWLRAVAADPLVAGPWLWLGDLYQRRGELGKAREAWTRFLGNARYGVYRREREVVEAKLRALQGRGAEGHP